MAADDDDPDVRLGRQITSGRRPTTVAVPDDPDVAAGRVITAPLTAAPAAATTSSTPAEQPPGGDWRSYVRNTAAGALEGVAGLGNFAMAIPENLALLGIKGAGTAYDFVAPHLGLHRMPDDLRNYIYGTTPTDTAVQLGTRTVNALGQGIQSVLPGDQRVMPSDVVSATPGEARARAATAGLVGGALFGAPVPGAAGAISGEVASEYVPEWLKPGVELAANVAGAKAGNIATNVGTRAAGAATGAKTPVAAAYDELGIDRRLLGDLSGDPTLRTVQAYSSKAPFGSSIVSPVEQHVVGQFGQAVENTAKRLGSSTSEQTAGEVLQSEARNWRDTVFPQRQAQAWTPVDRMLGNESVAPSNYRTALTSLTSKLAGLPDTAKALVPQKVWQLLDAINADVPTGKTMSWQQAQNLRSAVGQVLGVPEIVQSVGKDQLKAAYGGISSDMKDTAARVDAANAAATAAGGPAMPSAVDAFTNANKVSTDGHAFIEGTLSKIIRSNNPAQETITPERAAGSVLGSGDTTLEALRRELPKALDELAGYKLRDMALATPGAAGRTGTETSVGSFLTDLNRLRQQNPAGYRALFADPEVARKVEALAMVADTMKETARRVNTSNTGPYQSLEWATARGIGTYLASQDPYLTAGAIAAPFVANKVAANAVSNPLLARVASAPGPRNIPNPLLTGVVIGSLPAQQNNGNALAAPPRR